MKTSSEYRAAAWKEWRAQMGQSSAIILVSMLLGMVAISGLYGSFMWYKTTSSLTAGLVTIGIALVVIASVGLLNYLIPVWFLTLVRKQQKWYEAKTAYLRALVTSLVILIPNIIQEAVSLPMNMTNEPSIVMSLVFLAVMPVVVLLIIWWTYAISATLPFRVADHPERSVWEAVKENIRMMDGYKFKLFCVDFKIMVWPIVVLYAMIFLVAICMGVVLALAANTSMIMWISIAIGVIILPFILVFSFVFQPMMHIARAQFYEDMTAELTPAEPEVPIM